MDAGNLPRIYRTMTEIATDTIKEAILNGAYKPGTHLIPAKMERELNLGRVAIREALRELSGGGLVVSVPNKGAVVAEAFTVEELREIFEIRFDLEGKACELAAERISPPEIQKLEALNNDLLGYLANSREYFLLNRKWHLDLYRASGRNFLCQIVTQLFDRVLVYRSLYPFTQEAIPIYIEEHRQMIAALREKNGREVRRILVEHLSASLRSLIARRQMADGRSD